MFRRIQSALSTAHAISLAIREAPDAIRECVEFTRASSSLREEFDAASRSFDKTIEESNRERRNLRISLSDCREKCDNLRRELDACNAQITEARELLSGLSSGLGYGLGGEDESLPSMISRVEDGIKFNLKVMTEQRDTAQNERDSVKCNLSDCASLLVAKGHRVEFLESKLARHEAAERWRQVTAGEGELPPPIPVLWEPNSNDYHEQFRFIRSGLPDGWTTYRWRYISSQDVPCQP